MQRIVEEHGVCTVLRAIQFLIMRLEAHQLAPPVVDELRFLREELAQAQVRFDEMRIARLAATAEISYRDDRVDAAVLTLAREALRLCQGQRDAPFFSRLFPVAPEAAMASTAGNRQHEFLRELLSRLESDAEYAVLSSHVETLRRLQAQLEDALRRREACFEPEAHAIARRAEALADACRGYNRCQARLQLQRVDDALIESLYPVLNQGPLSERE